MRRGGDRDEQQQKKRHGQACIPFLREWCIELFLLWGTFHLDELQGIPNYILVLHVFGNVFQD